jgi:hypothetical protein
MILADCVMLFMTLNHARRLTRLREVDQFMQFDVPAFLEVKRSNRVYFCSSNWNIGYTYCDLSFLSVAGSVFRGLF